MNPQIYKGKARKLYLYSDLSARLGWFPNIAAFREQTGATWGVRTAHEGVSIPQGWECQGKEGGKGLANDPITPKKTMRDFVAALTPTRRR